MAGDAERQAPHDPAGRGFDGRVLSPVDPPAPGEPPSPAWLAQLGRAPMSDYADGHGVVKRLAEDGLSVPGDDPLYQYLGAQRVLVAGLEAQHHEQLGRTRAMLDEARQALAQLIAEVGAVGTAALGARRMEDEAALKRFSAELEEQAASATRKLREAMAEERDAVTAAIAVTVAEALARIDGEKAASLGRGRPWRPFGALGPGWAARARSAALWAALLTASVIAGLVCLWAAGQIRPWHGIH
jgi:hypothetical protein